MSAVAPPAPRANPYLVGQGTAEAALHAAWRSGRMPHAWLISGPRGIGKATLAFRFARFVLAGGHEAPSLLGAADRPGLEIAPDHPVFRRVASGGHADLLVVERSVNPDTGRMRSEIVIEEIRAIGDFLHLTPVEGGWRIVIVDGAEDMNRNSENALLKVLEEPPRQALLLLVCHAAGRLLPTIRSRCRQLPMPGLGPGDVAALLARYAPDLAASERQRVAQLADGSIGRALDLATQGGLELHDALLAIVGARDIEIGALHALADRVGGPSATALSEFRTLLDLAGRLAATIVKRAAGAAEAAASPDEEAALTRLAQHGAEHWLAVWDRIRQLSAASDGLNLDRRQTILATLLALRPAEG